MIKKIDLGAAMGGFAQAGDAGFVYGELSDGAQVKIRKADLLSGLIKSMGSFSPNNVELVNTMITPGVYKHGDSIVGTAGNFGLLLIIESESYVFQIDFTANYKILFRFSSNNGTSWANWKALSLV